MSRWLKIAVPMGIAAVLVTVLAIGFGSPRSDAAQCMEGAAGYTGRAGSTVTYEFDYCSDPTLALHVGLQWSNGKKDLALRITEPDGTQHVVDHLGGTSEGYIQGAPLDEGTWTVEVINKSNGSASYSLSVTFF